MHVSNDIIVRDGDMTSAITSEVIPVNQLWGQDITAFWTGTPSGEMILQVTAYPGVPPDQIPEGAWSTVDGAEIVLVAGNVTNCRVGEFSFTWMDTATNHKWTRLRYLPTSGTGVLNVYFNAKVP